VRQSSTDWREKGGRKIWEQVKGKKRHERRGRGRKGEWIVKIGTDFSPIFYNTDMPMGRKSGRGKNKMAVLTSS